MAKSRSRDDVENLRGRNRELQKQVRELKKRLSRFEKRINRVEDIEDLFEELELESVTPESPKLNLCSCGSKIVKVDLGIRTLFRCDSCGKRETKK